MHRCCPMLHAIQNKYFGENTVQMKRCVLKAVHASMTDSTELAKKAVTSDKCCIQSSNDCPRLSVRSSRVADVHHKGPAQLEQNVRIPTATTLYPLMALYALDRSTEDIALDPPNAKNEVYWNSIEVNVISYVEICIDRIAWNCSSNRRKVGILVTRDSVIRKSVMRSWRGHNSPDHKVQLSLSRYQDACDSLCRALFLLSV